MKKKVRALLHAVSDEADTQAHELHVPQLQVNCYLSLWQASAGRHALHDVAHEALQQRLCGLTVLSGVVTLHRMCSLRCLLTQ